MLHSAANSSPIPLWSRKLSVVRSPEDICFLHLGESLAESFPAKLGYFTHCSATPIEVSTPIDDMSSGNINSSNNSPSLIHQGSRCRVPPASTTTRKLGKTNSSFLGGLTSCCWTSGCSTLLCLVSTTALWHFYCYTSFALKGEA